MKQILQRMCVFCLFVVSPVAWAEQVVLTLFNWPDYVDPAVLQQFERETGIRIREVNYESDDLKDDLLLETGGEGLDVIISASSSMRNYARKAWLRRVDPAKVPNASLVAPWVRELSGDLTEVAIPYLWGSMGIAWRRDKAPVTVAHWKDLVQPDPVFHGRILMYNDAREMVAMALKTIGHGASSDDAVALEQAEALLLAQKPHVHRYGYEELSEKAGLVTGDIWLAPVFNGDALSLQKLEPNIAFVIPEEGAWLWVDQMAILKNSRHPEEAQKFLDFMQRADVAAQNAIHLGFATTNAAALTLIPRDVAKNPLIYLPEKLRQKCEFFDNLRTDQVAARNAIAAKVLD